MRGPGHRAHDLLAAGTRDVTPAAARGVARVLYAPLPSARQVARCCTGILSPAELHRLERLANEREKAGFAHRRAFRRFCAATALGTSHAIAEVGFEQTDRGRPYVTGSPELWFSFSSCRFGALGAWSSTHAVGVDLEDDTAQVDAVGLAQAYFSAAEADAVRSLGGTGRSRAFFRLWTLKEAALKSIGEGLAFGLEAFVFELVPEPRAVGVPAGHGGPGRFLALPLDGTDGCAALVVRPRAGPGSARQPRPWRSGCRSR